MQHQVSKGTIYLRFRPPNVGHEGLPPLKDGHIICTGNKNESSDLVHLQIMWQLVIPSSKYVQAKVECHQRHHPIVQFSIHQNQGSGCAVEQLIADVLVGQSQWCISKEKPSHCFQLNLLPD